MLSIHCIVRSLLGAARMRMPVMSGGACNSAQNKNENLSYLMPLFVFSFTTCNISLVLSRQCSVQPSKHPWLATWRTSKVALPTLPRVPASTKGRLAGGPTYHRRPRHHHLRRPLTSLDSRLLPHIHIPAAVAIPTIQSRWRPHSAAWKWLR